MFIFFIVAVLFALPQISHAAVVINEVAWMGSASSASDEWIELRNTSDAPVDLSSWTLTSGNNSVHATLSGAIAGSGYFLMERTDDSTVPNVAADVIYTGSLTNTGDTLTLRNAAGSIEDSVAGGENWANIGGDNASKDTANRTDLGWITAAPTPRAPNASVGTLPTHAASNNSTDTQSNTTDTTALKAAAITPQTPPPITVSAGGDRNVLIGTEVSFAATAYGKEGKPIANATYLWTFGDGTSAFGTHVLHRYSIPGNYAVMVSVGNIDTKETVDDRAVVHATSAAFTLTRDADGSLTLHNPTADDIDVGNFILTGGGESFTIPLHTIILANGFIRFEPNVMRFSGNASSELLYPNGQEAASSEGNDMSARGVTEEVEDAPVALKMPTRTRITEEPVARAPEASRSPVSQSQNAAAAESSGATDSPLMIWILALLALLGAAIAAVIFIRRENMQVDPVPALTADDFTIQETKSFID
jgi:hypothetical protein